MNKLVVSIIALMTASTAQAKQEIPILDAISEIKMTSLKAIESNGSIFFMSPNGRFVIQGDLTDTWQKKKLDTLKEIDYAAKHIDIERMGLPIDELNVIKVGKGKKEIVIFVDPQCDPCKKFFQEAKKHTDKYTFKFIVVPALGEESNKMATSMFCSKDKTNLAKHFLERTLLDLEQQENCDKKYYNLTLTIAQLIGIKHVPFFIAPGGLYQAGEGKDFWKWVEKES
jgi:thiol:disulfide interchange protein DsbC